MCCALLDASDNTSRNRNNNILIFCEISYKPEAFHGLPGTQTFLQCAREITCGMGPFSNEVSLSPVIPVVTENILNQIMNKNEHRKRSA